MSIPTLPSDPSVQDVINLYDSLGIPHFQRGFVWGDENTGLLLESLYFGTPCGTIILWEPLRPQEEGVSLSRSPSSMKYLVIDGQQRIRSLWGALGPGSEGLASSGSPVWCLNLSHVPELAPLLDESTSRFAMFRLVRDPTNPAVRSKQGFHNTVPLDILSGHRQVDLSEVIRPRGATLQGVMDRIDEIDLRGRVRSLKKKEVFFLKSFQESLRENHLAHMVALYNRINSAGKRVEPEEKAFATLASLYPSTSQWLKGIFDSVHPGPRGGNLERDDVSEHDDVLRRRKERNFGFKLFLRTFIQVCAYHFKWSLGSNSLSFDVVNSLAFQTRVKREPKLTQVLFDRTREIVLFVRGLLDTLNCDDLQMLPETTSLLPLFQVLIVFPKLLKLEPRGAKALQGLALRLLVSPNLTQREILDLVKRVNQAKSANECLRAVEHKLGEAVGDFRRQLSTRLEEANSLLDRYVLMLYWLLRRRTPRDFSYENLDRTIRVELVPGTEATLEASILPEKQHIVPYSLLEKLYNIEQRGRISQHRINNVGNITFISRKLNGLTGLGSKPIVLKLDPPENLECHFLGTSGGAGEAYIRAVDEIGKKAQTAPIEARRAFEDFCSCRRELIRDGFVNWVEELGLLTLPEDVEREEPLFAPVSQVRRPAGPIPADVWTRFWEGFNKCCQRAEHTWPEGLPLKPPPREGIYIWPLTKGSVNLSLAILAEGALRCSIGINPSSRSVFDQLTAQKEAIEAELGRGHKLVWTLPSDHSKWATISESRPARWDTEDDWPEVHSWLKDRTEAFHAVFAPRLRVPIPTPQATDEGRLEEWRP
jgi:hypothetical protein